MSHYTAIAKARHDELKRLWAAACKYDKIDPTSKFVVFSDKNPHVPKYNQMLGLYRETLSESCVVPR